jgi:hypothetical protein
MVSAQATGDMSDNRRRDVPGEHEVAEPLERLKKDKEAQPRPAPGKDPHGEGELFRGRRVDLRQLGRRHALFQTGIGGLVNGGRGRLTISLRTPRGRGCR